MMKISIHFLLFFSVIVSLSFNFLPCVESDVIDTSDCIGCKRTISSIWWPDDAESPLWAIQKLYLLNWTQTPGNETDLLLYRREADDLRLNWPGILASRMVDTMLWTSVNIFVEYAYDLTPIVIAENWLNIFPKRILELHSFNGKYLGFPDKYGFWGIFYKKSTFSQYNLTVPTTFQGFLDICEILVTQTTIIPIGLGVGDLWQPETWFEHIALNLGGVTWWDNLQLGLIEFDTDPVINRTYQILDYMIKSNYFPNATSISANQFSIADILIRWAKQEYAMVMMSSLTIAYTDYDPDYDFFEFPLIDENLPFDQTGKFSTSYVWIINKNSPNIDVAINLFKYMAQDSYARLSLPYLTGYAPSQTAVRQNLTSPVLRRGFDLLEASNKVYVFIDNTIPIFSAATRPSGVQYFSGQINSEQMIGAWEKARLETLLGQVAPPLINVIDSYVYLYPVTINSTLYINIALFARSDGTLIDSDSNSNSNSDSSGSNTGWIQYSSTPIYLQPGTGSYKIIGYARKNLMLDSTYVSTLFDTANVLQYASKLKFSDTASVFIILFAILGIILTLIFILGTYKKQNEEILKASSLFFCYLMLIGSLFSYISAFLVIGQSCIAAPILGHLSFYTIFSGLYAKNYRIMRIFIDGSTKLRIVNLSNLKLFVYLSIGYLILGLYLLVWNLRDPPKYVILDVINSVIYSGCSSSNNWWGLSLVIVEFFLLLVGVQLAWKTRAYPSNFNESSSIGNSIGNIIIFALLVVISDQAQLITRPDYLIYLWSSGMIGATIITMSLFFIPKFSRIFKIFSVSDSGAGISSQIRYLQNQNLKDKRNSQETENKDKDKDKDKEKEKEKDKDKNSAINPNPNANAHLAIENGNTNTIHVGNNRSKVKNNYYNSNKTKNNNNNNNDNNDDSNLSPKNNHDNNNNNSSNTNHTSSNLLFIKTINNPNSPGSPPNLNNPPQ